MKQCAYCHKEIEKSYYSYTDNFLQLKYFDEIDGSDNIFCDTDCAGKALFLEEFKNEDFGKNEVNGDEE
jgi:hypothetical protein